MIYFLREIDDRKPTVKEKEPTLGIKSHHHYW